MALYLIISVAIVCWISGFCPVSGYKHWREQHDCDPSKFAERLREACISYKRSANFFQPTHSRNTAAAFSNSEEDTAEAESLLLGVLSRRLPRHLLHSADIEGQQDSNDMLGQLRPDDDASISKQLKPKSRKVRDAEMLHNFMTQCCVAEEGCNMSHFITLEENIGYCAFDG